ncbi:hypothetical protein [Psittacicella hinzii]|uniref:Poly A polymerase head domain-containing protein n=1 Tax=Psittacicella hinzii TaxID=2028575 RepID=A0A3A1YH31_9GAMM|nr:hypothetical protein [Psittacicella hinzii]RIY37452.1 hypothetical protein CKF58_05010 [Psittacicella hinzii]
MTKPELTVYCVGGAIRDALLGIEPQEYDFVVTGATVDQFLAHQDFTQVNANFPVFIQKSTGQEYALARTEEKTSNGYTGFTFNTTDVSIEQDCQRRDLTINALYLPVAHDLDTQVKLSGAIIRERQAQILDPTGQGLQDLNSTSYAPLARPINENFWQDPLRFVRALRLSANKLFILEPSILGDLVTKMSAEDQEALFTPRPSMRKELEKMLVRNTLLNTFLPQVVESKLCTGHNTVPNFDDYFISEVPNNIARTEWFEFNAHSSELMQSAWHNLPPAAQEILTKQSAHEQKQEQENEQELILSDLGLAYSCLLLCFNDYWQTMVIEQEDHRYQLLTSTQAVLDSNHKYSSQKNPAFSQKLEQLWQKWHSREFVGSVIINQLYPQEKAWLEQQLLQHNLIIASLIQLVTQNKMFTNLEEAYFTTSLSKLRLSVLKELDKSSLFTSLLTWQNYPYLANILLRITPTNEVNHLVNNLDLNVVLPIQALVHKQLSALMLAHESLVQFVQSNKEACLSFQELPALLFQVWQHLRQTTEQTEVNLGDFIAQLLEKHNTLCSKAFRDYISHGNGSYDLSKIDLGVPQFTTYF